MKINLLRLLIVFSKYTLYGIVLQCLLFTVLVAASGKAQGIKSVHNVHLDINLENASLFETFAHIEARTNFKFAYDRQDIKKRTKVSLKGKNLTVGDLLLALSAQANLKFRQVNNYINVSKKDRHEKVPVNVIIQDNTITGNVKSGEDGQGLPGVNILVKGTNIGTVTDVEGNYTLNVPQNSETLVFSSIGFVTEEVDISNRTVINITLTPDIQALAEVVVIGYGTQKKANITGSIATMQTEQLQERPLTRVDQALVGQMAGVRVQQTSGLPGQGFRVQIRGTGSISANNEPLYVIDGFPLEVSPQNVSGGFSTGNPLDNINPNDIASIQVLKDASAAAIYGSRASNGVVIITTKRGKTGKATINFNAYAGVSREAKRVDFLSAEEWIDLATEVININYVNADPGDQNRSVTDDYETRLENVGSLVVSQVPDPRWDPNHPDHDELVYIDWQDELFEPGLIQNYNLSANGGNEFVKYFISGDYLDQEGIAVGIDYKRYSARTNVEIQANDRLKFGLNISPSYSIANDPGAEGKDQQMHLTGTVVPVSEASVGTEVNVFPNTFYAWGNSRVSPPAVLREALGETKTFRTLSTIFAEIDIIEGLTFKTTFNLDNADATTKNYFPAIVDRNRNTTGRLQGYRRQTFVNENTLSFDRTFDNAHNISVLAGISYNTSRFENWDMRGTFPNEGITTLNAAVINPDNTFSEETKNVLLSYFGRAQYNYDNRYLLTASIRRDGSSRFGADTKWGVFPSASAGWRLSEESFMENAELFSDLKIRASWGLSGNNGIPGRYQGNYEHIALLDFVNYSFGDALAIGRVPINFPNENLGWEESETFDVGFDLGLLQNRIYASFDYYTKTNSDLLLRINVPSATGFTTALTNIGKVKNKGWEVELTTQNLTGQFTWSTNINFSHNENEVLSLGPDNTDILGGSQDINHNILRVGEPMYSLYVVQQDGILSQAEIDAGAALLGSQTAGDPQYVDQLTVDTNGDGIPDERDGEINGDDRVISGKPNPDYVWGITNTLTYKGFDLNILVQGQWGGSIYSLYGRAVDRTSMGWNENRLGTWANRWRSEEDPGAGLKGKANGSFGRIKNTDWLYPSDYIRVRNITLGYDLGRLVNIQAIGNLRIYATAENYFGSDKYDGGWNPEAVNFEGDDYGAFPLSKSLIFGLNVTF